MGSLLAVESNRLDLLKVALLKGVKSCLCMRTVLFVISKGWCRAYLWRTDSHESAEMYMTDGYRVRRNKAADSGARFGMRARSMAHHCSLAQRHPRNLVSWPR